MQTFIFIIMIYYKNMICSSRTNNLYEIVQNSTIGKAVFYLHIYVYTYIMHTFFTYIHLSPFALYNVRMQYASMQFIKQTQLSRIK